MKILVFSDSHGSFSYIYKNVEKEKDVDMIIHAGDIQRDVDDILMTWQNIPCVYVLGNNDFNVFNTPYDRVFEIAQKRIFLTHGHNYGVKSSLARLEATAKSSGAQICVFGHTHTAHLEQKDGLWFLNPGPAHRSYGVIEIANGNIEIEIKEA